MFERSEFLSSRKTSTERREPEGQGVGAPFLCFLSLGVQREEVVVWGRNPKVFACSRRLSGNTRWNGRAGGLLNDIISHRFSRGR